MGSTIFLPSLLHLPRLPQQSGLPYEVEHDTPMLKLLSLEVHPQFKPGPRYRAIIRSLPKRLPEVRLVVYIQSATEPRVVKLIARYRLKKRRKKLWFTSNKFLAPSVLHVAQGVEHLA